MLIPTGETEISVQSPYTQLVSKVSVRAQRSQKLVCDLSFDGWNCMISWKTTAQESNSHRHSTPEQDFHLDDRRVLWL